LNDGGVLSNPYRKGSRDEIEIERAMISRRDQVILKAAVCDNSG